MKMMQRIMAKMPGYISCKELDEKLDDYVEGDLSLWNRFRFGFHFVMCKACAAYAAGYRSTIAILKNSIDDENVPAADEPVSEELIQSIINNQQETRGQ